METRMKIQERTKEQVREMLGGNRDTKASGIRKAIQLLAGVAPGVIVDMKQYMTSPYVSILRSERSFKVRTKSVGNKTLLYRQ